MLRQNSRLPVPEALHLAYTHHKAGRRTEAEAIYRNIIAAEPNNVHALHLLGLLALQEGKFGIASTLIERAISQRADVPDFHTHLGEALRMQGKAMAAIDAQLRAQKLAPDIAEIQVNLANAYRSARRVDDAIRHYQKALMLDEKHQIALINLAACLEKANRIEEAVACVRRGLRAAPDSPMLNLTAARLARRQGHFHEGIEQLERLHLSAQAPRIQQQMRYELAFLYDRNGEVDKAFEMFVMANKIARANALSAGIDVGLARHQLESVCNWLAGNPGISNWPVDPAGTDRSAPVFLVGFPRSGTTLLETALASHSGIRTLDEMPILEALKDRIERAHGKPYPEVLSFLSKNEIELLRSDYFARVDSILGDTGKAILIDKLPLNIVFLPLIKQIFPDARILFAARHPADSVLSCFMQDFTPNSAMANFHTLQDAAEFYDLNLSLWRLCVDTLSLPFHVVKYERLLDDFENEMKRALEFIGLEWQPQIAEFNKTALARGIISTPSYHQVAEPLYQRARGRWLNYEHHLKEVMPKLTPWIDYLNYSG